MINNTLMEAILLSRALCHSECPPHESERFIAAEAVIMPEAPGCDPGPGSGLFAGCGLFSVDISTGATRYNMDGVRPGINIGLS